LILEYRQLLKLKSTYIDGVVPFVAKGALKPNWLHTGTCTGRIASSSPNIQSFPKQEITIDKDTATSSVSTTSSLCKPKIFSVDIRNAVCSRPECMFVAADFKSIELRLLAHLSEDPDLLKVMNDPKASDIFTLLTSEWLGKKEHEVSTQERERTKRVVYGVVYGVGKERLAEILSSTSQLAKELMDGFLSKFSGVQKFIHRTIEYCQKHGHVVSLLGRKRFLPSIHSKNHMERSHSERQAVNFVVQGSAADLCKCSMIEVAEVLCRECPKARMVLQIHDELVYELPNSCTPDLMDKVKSTLERCSLFQSLMGPLQVRIEVRMERGSTWSNVYR
jgi:DNA polymerase nu